MMTDDLFKAVRLARVHQARSKEACGWLMVPSAVVCGRRPGGAEAGDLSTSLKKRNETRPKTGNKANCVGGTRPRLTARSAPCGGAMFGAGLVFPGSFFFPFPRKEIIGDPAVCDIVFSTIPAGRAWSVVSARSDSWSDRRVSPVSALECLC